MFRPLFFAERGLDLEGPLDFIPFGFVEESEAFFGGDEFDENDSVFVLGETLDEFEPLQLVDEFVDAGVAEGEGVEVLLDGEHAVLTDFLVVHVPQRVGNLHLIPRNRQVHLFLLVLGAVLAQVLQGLHEVETVLAVLPTRKRKLHLILSN